MKKGKRQANSSRGDILRIRISLGNDFMFRATFFILAIGMNVFVYIYNPLYKLIIVIIDLLLLGICSAKIKIEQYHVALLLFIGWNGLTLLWSNYDVDIKVFPTFIYCFVTTVIIHQFLNRKSRLIVMMKCMIVSAYLLWFAMVMHFGLITMFTSRVNNEVVNTNRAGTIFASSLFFCMYLFYYEKRKGYLVAGGLNFVFVLLSGSKSALIIAASSIFMLAVLKDGIKSEKLFKNFLIGAILIAVGILLIIKIPYFYNIIGARFIEFIQTMTGRRQILVGEHSIYMRMTLSKFGLQKILQNPLLGYGLDSFRYMPGNPWPGRVSHMNYIELWFNLGIIGLVLYYWPFVTFIRYYKKIKRNLNKLDKAFFSGFMVYYALYGMMGIFFNELFEWTVMEMMCSFVLIKYRECKSSFIMARCTAQNGCNA